MPSSSQKSSLFARLEHKVAGFTIDSLGRRWDPALHPRDSRGRFIETGGIARVGLGGLGRVVRSMLGGKVEVEMGDGRHKIVPHQQLTMVARPDGSKPTASVRKVVAEDARREKDPVRGDGKLDADHGDKNNNGIPDHQESVLANPDATQHDRDKDNPYDGDDDDAEIPDDVPDAYTPSRHEPREGDLIALTRSTDKGPKHVLGKIDSVDADGKPDKITLAGGRAKVQLGNAKVDDYTVIPHEDIENPHALLVDAEGDDARPATLDNELAADLVEGHAKTHKARPPAANRPKGAQGGGKVERPVVKTEDLTLGKKPGTIEHQGRVVGRIEKDGEKFRAYDPWGRRSKRPAAQWDTARDQLAAMLNNPPAAVRNDEKAKPEAPRQTLPGVTSPEERDLAREQTLIRSGAGKPAEKAPEAPQSVAQVDRATQDVSSNQAGALTRKQTSDGDTANVSKSGALLAIKEAKGYSVYQRTDQPIGERTDHTVTVDGQDYVHVGDTATLEEFRGSWVGSEQDRDHQWTPAFPNEQRNQAAAPAPAAAETPAEPTQDGPPADGVPTVYHGASTPLPSDLLPREAVTKATDNTAGQGFYTTDDPDHAGGWGKQGVYTIKGSKSGKRYQVFDINTEVSEADEAEARDFIRAYYEPLIASGAVNREDVESLLRSSVNSGRSWNYALALLEDRKVSDDADVKSPQQLVTDFLEQRRGAGVLKYEQGLNGHHAYVWLHPEDLIIEKQGAPDAPALAERHQDAPNPQYPETTTPEGATDEQPLRAAGQDVLGDVPAGADRESARPDELLRQPERAGVGRGGQRGAVDPRLDAEGDRPVSEGRAEVAGDQGRGAQSAGRPGVPDAGARDRGPRDADGASDGDRPGVADTAPAPKPAPQQDPEPAQSFSADSQGDLARTGFNTRLADNIEALRTVRQIEAEGRTTATPEEQRKLARWSGWGSLAQALDENNPKYAEQREELRHLIPSQEEWSDTRENALNAHYTDLDLVKATWEGLQDLGFDGGTVLEPGAGSGNFIGTAPKGTKMVGVEKERITGKIAQLLYPQADVRIQPFEQTRVGHNTFDAAVGNVPFGKYPVVDPEHNPDGFSIHNAFILKAINATKPGGLVALHTSRFTMDGTSPKNRAARESFYKQADLVGAVRLPQGSHAAAAGTDVITDLLIFRKRKDGEQPRDGSWLNASDFTGPSGATTAVNDYFKAHPENMLGTPDVETGGQHGPDAVNLTLKGDPKRAGTQMRSVLSDIAADARANDLTYAPEAPKPADDAARTSRRRPSGKKGDQRTAEGVLLPVEAPDTLGEGVIAEVSEPFTRTITHGANGKPLAKPRTESTTFTQVFGGKAEPYFVPSTQTEELRHLIGLRNTFEALKNAEAASDTDTPEVKRLRQDLNDRYAAYVAKFDAINRFTLSEPDPVDEDDEEGAEAKQPRRVYPPQAGVRFNPAFASVFALDDDYDPQTKTATRASVFEKRTVAKRSIPTTADNPDDALALVQESLGHIDLGAVATMLGKKPAETRRILGDKVFEDHNKPSRLIPRAEYLSGDIRQKLREVRERAAAEPGKWDNHVAALETVKPEDKTPANIMVTLGAPWIKAEYVEQFANEMMGAVGYKAVTVENPGGSMWTVRGSGRSTVRATQQWGTQRKPFHNLLEQMLSQSDIKVFDEVELGDGKKKRVLNPDATLAAQDKAEEVADRFSAWVWEDPNRASDLLNTYNDRFNSLVGRSYDGSAMRSYPGMTPDWAQSFMQHQNDAVTRAINEPSALFAHVVGAGKTAEMTATAMELRRLGLAKKPAIVVPNHMLSQWNKEFLEVYPQAKVLAVDSSVLSSPDKRRTFLARVRNGDWDAVIMTQESFKAIPVSEANERAYLNQELDTLRAMKARAAAADGKSPSIKKIETAIKNAEARIKNLLDSKKDRGGLTFEETGIDYLMVDEAHHYKNLRTVSSDQSLSKPGSQKATDLDMKLWHLRGTTKSGRVVTFATGTPIANSISEAYVMQKFLRPDLLEAAGIEDFDSWVASFAEKTTSVEMTVAGKFRQRTRFAKFRNLSGLLRMWSVPTDTKLAEDLTYLKRPLLKTQEDGERKASIEAVPSSQIQKDYLAWLGERAERVENGMVTPDEDNLLKIASDGRKAAFDMRLVNDPEFEETYGYNLRTDTGSQKVNQAADNIARIYTANKDRKYQVSPKDKREHATPGGLQIVFADLGTPKDKDSGKFSTYDELKKQLIARGVPAEKIRFIHEANTAQEKAVLFEAARNGDISVLVGSTEKMGVGTNVQNRALALHHLDVPWRPADLEQREGRVIRQGNQNGEVEVARYVTEGTFDAFMWGAVERKAGFIQQMMRGDLDQDEIEDVSDVAADAAMVKSIASGNPLLVDQAFIGGELRKLRKLDRQHKNNVDYAQRVITDGDRRIESLDFVQRRIEAALAKRTELDPENPKIGLRDRYGNNERTTTGKKEVGQALAGALAPRMEGYMPAGEGRPEVIGSFGGLTLVMRTRNIQGLHKSLVLSLSETDDQWGAKPLPGTDVVVGPNGISSDAGLAGILLQLSNRHAALEGEPKRLDAQKMGIRREQADARDVADRGFGRADELGLLEERAKTLDETLQKWDAEDGSDAAQERDLARQRYTAATQKFDQVVASKKPAKKAKPAPVSQEAVKEAQADVAEGGHPTEVDGIPVDVDADTEGDGGALSIDPADLPTIDGDDDALPLPQADEADTDDADQGDVEPVQTREELAAERARDAAAEDATDNDVVSIAPEDLPTVDGDGAGAQPPAAAETAEEDSDLPQRGQKITLADGRTVEFGDESFDGFTATENGRDIDLDEDELAGWKPFDRTNPNREETLGGTDAVERTPRESKPAAPKAEAQSAPTGSAAPSKQDGIEFTDVESTPDAPTIMDGIRETEAEDADAHEERVEEARADAENEALADGATREEATDAGETAAAAAHADEATSDADATGERTLVPDTAGDAAREAEAAHKEGRTPSQLPGEKYPLNDQQQVIADVVVADRKDALVRAKAGTGKTSTLEAIARRFEALDPKQKILYVCFNKTVQVEADGRMPGNVESRTGHSLAYQWVGKDFTDRKMGAPGKKALNKVLYTDVEVADYLGITNDMGTKEDGGSWAPRRQAMIALKAVGRFANSADDDITYDHFTTVEGQNLIADLPDREKVRILGYAKKAWADVQSPDGQVRTSFDHIRKMWALSRPDLTQTGSGTKRAATVLFLDEAQDTPPVLAKIVADQKMQKVIVGDADQQIYSFTGAKNYLDDVQVDDDADLPLSTSYRFGKNIADAANRFLQVLGSKERVVGGGREDGKVRSGAEVGTMGDADAILTRSNAGMIGSILSEQMQDRTVGVPKGTKKDLKLFIDSARYLKGEGAAPSTMHEDLAPFQTWADVEKAIEEDGDPKLTMLDSMIGKYGLDGLEAILDRVVEVEGTDEGGSTVAATGPLAKVTATNDGDHMTLTGSGTFEVNKFLKEDTDKGLGQFGFRWDGTAKVWGFDGTPAAQASALDRLRAAFGVSAGSADKPDVMVLTAHKSKGLEWDRVKLGDDFKGPKANKETGEVTMPSDEELRLSYVAVTRAGKELDPGSLAWVFEHSDANGGEAGSKPEATSAPNAEATPAEVDGADVETEPKVTIDPADLPRVDDEDDQADETDETDGEFAAPLTDEQHTFELPAEPREAEPGETTGKVFDGWTIITRHPETGQTVRGEVVSQKWGEDSDTYTVFNRDTRERFTITRPKGAPVTAIPKGLHESRVSVRSLASAPDTSLQSLRKDLLLRIAALENDPEGADTDAIAEAQAQVDKINAELTVRENRAVLLPAEAEQLSGGALRMPTDEMYPAHGGGRTHWWDDLNKASIANPDARFDVTLTDGTLLENVVPHENKKRGEDKEAFKDAAGNITTLDRGESILDVKVTEGHVDATAGAFNPTEVAPGTLVEYRTPGGGPSPDKEFRGVLAGGPGNYSILGEDGRDVDVPDTGLVSPVWRTFPSEDRSDDQATPDEGQNDDVVSVDPADLPRLDDTDDADADQGDDEERRRRRDRRKRYDPNGSPDADNGGGGMGGPGGLMVPPPPLGELPLYGDADPAGGAGDGSDADGAANGREPVGFLDGHKLPRPTATDAQLAILGEVARTFVDPDGYTEQEGASRVGFHTTALRKLIDQGLLTETDTGDVNTDGGRYRLHLTDDGREQLRRGLAHRLLAPDDSQGGSRESVAEYLRNRDGAGTTDADTVQVAPEDLPTVDDATTPAAIDTPASQGGAAYDDGTTAGAGNPLPEGTDWNGGNPFNLTPVGKVPVSPGLSRELAHFLENGQADNIDQGYTLSESGNLMLVHRPDRAASALDAIADIKGDQANGGDRGARSISEAAKGRLSYVQKLAEAQQEQAPTAAPEGTTFSGGQKVDPADLNVGDVVMGTLGSTREEGQLTVESVHKDGAMLVITGTNAAGQRDSVRVPDGYSTSRIGGLAEGYDREAAWGREVTPFVPARIVGGNEYEMDLPENLGNGDVVYIKVNGRQGRFQIVGRVPNNNPLFDRFSVVPAGRPADEPQFVNLGKKRQVRVHERGQTPIDADDQAVLDAQTDDDRAAIDSLFTDGPTFTPDLGMSEEERAAAADAPAADDVVPAAGDVPTDQPNPADDDDRPEPLVNGVLENQQGLTAPADVTGDYSPDQLHYLAEYGVPVVVNHDGKWTPGTFEKVGDRFVLRASDSRDQDDVLDITPESIEEIRGVRSIEAPAEEVDPTVLRPGTRVMFVQRGRLRAGILETVTPQGRAMVRDANGDLHATNIGGKVRPIVGGYRPGSEPTEEAFAPNPGVWAPVGTGFAAGVPGEWVAGVAPDGDQFRWEVQGFGGGFSNGSGTAETAAAAKDAVLDHLWVQAANNAGITTLPGDNDNDRDERSRDLADTLGELRGADETEAARDTAEETASAPDINGENAGWVPTGELEPGDVARVEGDNGNGSATTRTGHVLGTPETVEVHSPAGGAPQAGHRTTVGGDRDGLGDRDTVLTPDASVAARVERNEEESGDSDDPRSAFESQILSGNVSDTMPLDANGVGIFPGSTVHRGDRSGVVTEVWDRDVAVRWADKDRDERLRPGLLTVDGQTRPDGWTREGRLVEPNHMVELDGEVGRVEAVNGDQITVEVGGNSRVVSAADLKVVGRIADDKPEDGFAGSAYDEPPTVEGHDVRPTEPTMPMPLPEGADAARPNLTPEDRAALVDLGIDTDAITPLEVQEAAARIRFDMPITRQQADDLAAWLGDLAASPGVPAGRKRQIKRLRNRITAAGQRAGAAEERPAPAEPVLDKVSGLARGDVVALPNAATGEVEPATIKALWWTQNGQAKLAIVEYADGTSEQHTLLPDAEVYRLPDLNTPLWQGQGDDVDEERQFIEPRVSTRAQESAQAVVDAAVGDEESASLAELAEDVTDRVEGREDARDQRNSSRRHRTSLDEAGVSPEAADAGHDAAERAADQAREHVTETVLNTVHDAEPLPGESDAEAADRTRDRLLEAVNDVDYDAEVARAMEGSEFGAPTRAEQGHARREMADALRADLFSMADQLAAMGDVEGANALSDVAARLAGRPDEAQVQRAVAAASMGQGPGKVRTLASRIRGMFTRARRRFLDRVRSLMNTGAKAKRSFKAAVAAARAEWTGDDAAVARLVGDAAKHLAAGGDKVADDVATVEPTGFTARMTHWLAALPEDSGMFGRTDTPTRSFRGLSLARLRAGEPLTAEDTTGSRVDRAADGGPGPTAIGHYEAVRGLGGAVDDEVAARVRAALPDLGDDPAETVREARRYAEEVAREERGDLTDDELAQLRAKAKADADEKAAAYANAKAQATREVLAAIRPMGPSGAASLNVQGRSADAPEVQALRWAEQFVPTDWLTGAGTVEAQAGRMGSYKDGTITVAPLLDGSVEGSGRYGASAMHGLAHHLETTVPGLAQAAWVHHWLATSAGRPGNRQRRGRNGLAWLRDRFKGAGFTNDDGAVRWAWDALEQDESHYEWIPAGFEDLFGDATKDDDLRKFMMGLLAWLARRD